MNASPRNLLVPTDFSSCSDGALVAALSLAEAYGASLHLIHAVVLHGEDPYNPAHYSPDPEALFERLRGEAENRVTELRAGWMKSSVQVTSEIRRGIHPAPVILEAAENSAADLIVLGTHGRRGPRRWLLGSVAEEVVRRAPCPVLTVREGEEAQDRLKVKKILVPLDFSDHAQATLDVALDLARRYDAELKLLHLIEPVVVPGPYGTFHSMRPVTLDYEVLAKQAKETLTGLMERAEDIEFEAHAFNGMPRVDIVGFAAQMEADLIVIGSHGRTGFQRFLLGSTAEQVVRTADCPVLVVKSPEVLGRAQDDLPAEGARLYPGVKGEESAAAPGPS